MRKSWILSAATFAALVFQGTAPAQDKAGQPPVGMATTAPVAVSGCSGCSSCTSGPSCLSGCDSGCSEHKGGGIVFGVEFPILKTSFNDPSHLTQTGVDPGSGRGQVDTHAAPVLSRIDPEDHMRFSARWTLGFEGENGLGFRTRFWNYHGADKANLVVNNVGNNGFLSQTTTFQTYRAIQMDTWDFEAYKRWSTDAGTSVLVSGGVRYANLNIRVQRINTDIESGNIPTGGITAFDSKVNFYGAGPTVSAEVGQRLGQSGLHLFANMRGSLVFGTTNIYLINSDVNDVPSDYNLHRGKMEDMVVPILECQVGGFWSKQVGNAEVFASVAFEAQAWLNATDGDFAGPPNVLRFSPFSMDNFKIDSTMGLVGVTLGFGIRR